MADVLVLGTMALDTVETPFGRAHDALGGSAAYAAFSASFFAKPAIVSVIGNDFPKEYISILEKRNVDLNCVKFDSKTFRWKGLYEYDMAEAKTLSTELNSLAGFKPDVKDKYRHIEYVFLANIDPMAQLEVIKQIKNPSLIVLDTMNFWIENKKAELMKAISKANVVIFNEAESRQIFQTTNLIAAANKALELGPKCIVIKKGEHGALMFMDGKHFSAPGYPLENIKDPTGAGDSFGGAFIGYLAKSKDLSERNFRRAVVYGSVIASFNAEDFSLHRLNHISLDDIEKRYNQMKDIREF